MSRLLTILLVPIVVGLLFAGVAHAGTTVPPGSGEADQYAETVPGAGGNETPGGTNGPEDLLPSDDVDELQSAGPDGRGAAALAAATAPADSDSGRDQAGAGDGASGAEGDGGAIPSAAAPVRLTAPAEDGLGVALWVIVAVAGIGAVVYPLAHRRVSAR